MNLEKAKAIFQSKNYFCFTSDLDWAPETAIEETLNMLLSKHIKPTVFVTHKSEVVARFSREIDLGIHPNFVQPSSQGNNIEEVIQYCNKLLPETKVFRCHRWFSSNDVYDQLAALGFLYESNLCTNMDIVLPFLHRSGLVSFPVYFEDGAYIINNKELVFDHAVHKFETKGLKVINIHPMHYALNTPYFLYTREIKDRLSRNEWNKMDEKMLKSLTFEGNGIRNFIDSLINYATKESDVEIITLKEAYHICLKGESGGKGTK